MENKITLFALFRHHSVFANAVIAVRMGCAAVVVRGGRAARLQSVSFVASLDFAVENVGPGESFAGAASAEFKRRIVAVTEHENDNMVLRIGHDGGQRANSASEQVSATNEGFVGCGLHFRHLATEPQQHVFGFVHDAPAIASVQLQPTRASLQGKRGASNATAFRSFSRRRFL